MARVPETLTSWAQVVARYGDTVVTFKFQPEAFAFVTAGQVYKFDGNGAGNPWMESTATCIGKGPDTEATFNFPDSPPGKGANYFTPGNTNHVRLIPVAGGGEGVGSDTKPYKK